MAEAQKKQAVLRAEPAAEKTVNSRFCKVTINGRRELDVPAGKSLLTALRDEKILVPTVCRGRGICGVCKVKVLHGGGAILPTETPLLTKEEQRCNIRLSCQITVQNDIAVEIPEPVLSVREYDTVCTEIEELTYDMKRFRFELKNPPSMKFVAGQFVQLLCPRYKESSEAVYRAYSIASNPNDNGYIDLIIRKAPRGICTTWCFDYLKTGRSVRLSGPYGDFHLSDTDAPIICIAGGSGMAPFVSMLNAMRDIRSKRQVSYFFGGNTVRDLCLQEQMKIFESVLPGFMFIPVVARPAENERWSGQTGLVTEAVQRQFKDLSRHEGYLCGGPGMIDASIKVLKGLGMPDEKIYYDRFA
ncbi:MAG: 2Fe-2S iron-sulfur cluster binding domain-containing protein [Planctomycetales bacterium]|nr:2Fe-2S iron-sulfur cluster binding domain-containing protein [Planctomycetales bacterium]